MTGKKSIALLGMLIVFGLSFSPEIEVEKNTEEADQTYLIIRTDDLGMSHSVNMGLEKLLKADFPISASVMFACPWYMETVEILKKHPEVTVGIHLTLNSEWSHYRWSPVIGKEAGSTLVDENGFFFHSTIDLYNNEPDLEQVELELTAQIERALNSGLDITYVDYHMGTAVRNPEFRKITEKVAEKYNLAMFSYYGGDSIGSGYYRANPEEKLEILLAALDDLQPGYNYLVTHVGLDNAELSAMKDMNADTPLLEMSKNRQAELDALTHPKFLDAVKQNNITLITYREMMQKEGLENMKQADID